jgi:sugar transferase (PEP-CTERM/EpsH1 system associated)
MSADTNKNGAQRKLLVAHVLFRFDYGGLENGVVNLVNRLPAERFDHAIVALTEATDFRNRVRRSDVAVHALGKRPGNDPRMYWRLYRLLRRLRPDIVHTRNFGTLDCSFIAWLAGVPRRIHGEHGWDINDPDGTVRKYQLLRRVFGLWVQRWLTVSRDLSRWLAERCRIPATRIGQIYNGVDTERFRPTTHPAASPSVVTIGTVTRFQPIKDPLNLARAYIHARRLLTDHAIELRLVLAGDGDLRKEVEAVLAAAGASSQVQFLGSRDDVAALLPTFDVFVLASRREGISNTILEAMACGLPVIATATGGNLEIVEDGTTGTLVPVQDAAALGAAIARYALDAALRRAHGQAGRQRAEQRYALDTMVGQYADCYLSLARGAT